MMRCRALFPLLSVAAVAGCVAPPRQAPSPPAPPVAIVPPAPPPAPADWRDRPYAAGDWHHVADATRPAAQYRGTDGAMLFALNCDRPTRTISLALPGPTAATAAALTIRTTSTTRALPIRALAPADATTPPTTVATLAATDPLLDAMAFSRGRFVVERPSQPPLVLPAWAEVGRLIDDCRR